MFTVNGNTWRIVFVNPDEEVLRRSDNTLTIGVTDNLLKTIFLSNALHGGLLKKVLCHEITHVFCFEYNITLSIELEERLADFISNFGEEIIELTDSLFRVLKRSA